MTERAALPANDLNDLKVLKVVKDLKDLNDLTCGQSRTAGPQPAADDNTFCTSKRCDLIKA